MRFTASSFPFTSQVPRMSLRSAFLRLLRDLRIICPKHLIQFLRHFWGIIWRFIRERAFLTGPLLPSSKISSTKDSLIETTENDEHLVKEEPMDTVLCSVQPSILPSSVYTISRSSITSSSGSDIGLNIVPPDAADPEGEGVESYNIEDTLPSHRDSITPTFTSGQYNVNNISYQELTPQTSLDGSRLYVVVPRAASPQRERPAEQLGTHGSQYNVNNISYQTLAPQSAFDESRTYLVVPRAVSTLVEQLGTTGTMPSQHDPNIDNISFQGFTLQPSPGGSRISLVIPHALSHQRDGYIVQLGTSSSTSFSEGVSSHIYPLMPNEIHRYKRVEKKMNYTRDVRYRVPAGQQAFMIGELPDGWEQIIHPEGQPYFYHREKRIVTENWIYDYREVERLQDFIDQFEDFSRSRNLYQPPDTHLVLETVEVDDEVWCGYYYACASTRSVFWLEMYDISTNHLREVQGDISPTHIKQLLEFQYWIHWDSFPNVNETSIAHFDLLSNIISDARTDLQSNHQSTFNYTTADLKEWADIVESASRRDGSNWCIGRFMHLLMKDRFVNSHGQFGGRLNQNQSFYEMGRQPRSWFITILSPVLFAAPNAHLKTIEKLWTDQVTLKARCLDFFGRLNTQWSKHIVHALILLIVNVAFLAILFNISTVGVLPSRSAAQIASYLSIVTSFTSMMTAVLLVQWHKTNERVTADDFHKYFESREHKVLGFEHLAGVYSLPYALLTWGMITFLIAFILMCFQISKSTAHFVVGAVIMFMCVLIAWCIGIAWAEADFHWGKRFKEYRGRVTAKYFAVAEAVRQRYTRS